MIFPDPREMTHVKDPACGEFSSSSHGALGSKAAVRMVSDGEVEHILTRSTASISSWARGTRIEPKIIQTMFVDHSTVGTHLMTNNTD